MNCAQKKSPRLKMPGRFYYKVNKNLQHLLFITLFLLFLYCLHHITFKAFFIPLMLRPGKNCIYLFLELLSLTLFFCKMH